MAKRMTDTDKWKKGFVRGLKGPYKLLWFYLCDECDHAGIWEVDFEIAQIKIGVDMKITLEGALDAFKTKVLVFDAGRKWFIPSFIDFQYGELNEKNRAHNSAILILKKHGLVDDDLKIKPLISPLYGAMDKDKDKDKEKDKDKRGLRGENELKKKTEKKGIIFPSEKMESIWKVWTDYKKSEFKDSYKTDASEQKAFNTFNEMAGGDPVHAQALIDNAIFQHYKGIFPIKNYGSSSFKSSNTTVTGRANQLAGFESAYQGAKEAYNALNGSSDGIGSAKSAEDEIYGAGIY